MNEFKIDVEDNCLVLLSGGIGAATLLACLKKQNVEQVNALFFYYGNCVSKERQCAEMLANYYDVNLRVMDISNIYGNNMSVGYPVSFKQVNDFYIPYRNGVFVSLASALACVEGKSDIVWGISNTASSHFPDASWRFVESQKEVIKVGTYGRVGLKTPFLGMEKFSVVRLAEGLDVPLKLTWSCIQSCEIACGKCFGCFDREFSMRALGPVDTKVEMDITREMRDE